MFVTPSPFLSTADLAKIWNGYYSPGLSHRYNYSQICNYHPGFTQIPRMLRDFQKAKMYADELADKTWPVS